MKILIIVVVLFLPACSLLRSWDFDCIDACESNDKLSVSTFNGKNVSRKCECISKDFLLGE